MLPSLGRYSVVLFVVACASACAQSQVTPSPIVADVVPVTLPHPKESLVAPVEPPRNPRASSDFPSEAELARASKLSQPNALTDALLDLERGSVDERIAKLRTKVVADLVFVKGGKFLMGDFAGQWVPGAKRSTYNEDDKPPREITLSDYWIGKYKTSYAEFDVFSDAMARPRTGMEYDGKHHHPLLPAGTYWPDAKGYCQWLGKITGLPFDLPTEAQWEYAARSRGQFFLLATDNGMIERGRNFPYSNQQLLPVGAGDARYPVGIFAPNPLGLYDMAYDGLEWVNDWYAEDAYAKAAAVDPNGPATGERKVARGWGQDDIKAGGTVWRWKYFPGMEYKNDNDPPDWPKRLSSVRSPTVRCVVNPPK